MPRYSTGSRNSPGRDHRRSRSNSPRRFESRSSRRSRSPARKNSGRRRSSSPTRKPRSRSPHVSSSKSHDRKPAYQSIERDRRTDRKDTNYGDRQGKISSSHGDRDYRQQPQPIIPIPTIKLTERFTDIGDNPRYAIIADEQITVGIQRKVRGIPVDYVNYSYDPNYVIIQRKKEEGKKPIFDREEIINAHIDSDDEGERRVIRVVKPDESRTIRSSHHGDSYQSDRYDRGNFSMGGREEYKSDRDIDMRQKPPGIDFNPVIHIRDDIGGRPIGHDNRNLFGDRLESVQIHRRLGPVHSMEDRIGHQDINVIPPNPNDLRYNLLSKRRQSESSRDNFNTRSRVPERTFDDHGKIELKRNEIFVRDDRFNTVTVIHSSENERGRNREGRLMSIGERLQKEAEPPKFSDRPDKGMFEEWKVKPELIPKGGMYYEHDNRDDPTVDYWERRGRGRGRGFRGRGGFRGQGFYRGRGGWRGRGMSDFSRSWKHDMFDKLEDDSKPSSTTDMSSNVTKSRKDPDKQESRESSRRESKEDSRHRRDSSRHESSRKTSRFEERDRSRHNPRESRRQDDYPAEKEPGHRDVVVKTESTH